MGKTDRVEGKVWRRPIAMALAVLWLVVGVLPGLHRHDSVPGHDFEHCLDSIPGHDSEPTASQFYASREAPHPEACDLCAKLSSFEGPERPRAPLVGDLAAERAEFPSSTKPPVSPGRHGAARAPPSV